MQLPTQEDKAWPRLGEGWEEETRGSSCPAPHSSANELQPDGGIAGRWDGEGGGENREAGGQPGYQPTWYPRALPHPNPKHPQEGGLAPKGWA